MKITVDFPIESAVGAHASGWYESVSQVSSGLLQTAQTWANAGVCGGLCACAVGGTFD